MTVSERYRVTSWPTQTIPVPSVACFPVALEYGAIAVDWEAKGEEREAWPEELPDELYLRGLRDLDLDDEVALAGFVYQHGWFCRPDWRSLPVRFTHVGGRVGQLRPEFQRGLPDSYTHDEAELGRLHPYLAGIDAIIAGIAAYRAEAQRPRMLWQSTRAHRGFIHVGELRVHAEFLRNAVLVWDALSNGDALDELPERWEGIFGLPQLLKQGWELEAAASVYLQETLAAALAEFHPRILISVPDAELGAPEVTLYEAMALQLYNDVSARLPYQSCAKCGRLFLRQQGSSRYNQHRRIGTMYCSADCGNAAKQKRYRDRKRAEKLAETSE